MELIKKLSIKPDFDHKGRTPSWNLLNVPHESPFIANYRVGRVLILDGFIDVTITTPVYASFRIGRRRLGIAEVIQGRPLFILNEIYSTEKTYVNNLSSLITVYQEPMQGSKRHKQVDSPIR